MTQTDGSSQEGEKNPVQISAWVYTKIVSEGLRPVCSESSINTNASRLDFFRANLL